MQIFWISIVVLISVATVVGIDYATKVHSLFFKFALLAFVLSINGAKFIVWGYIHKHFPLGSSYAMASIFYPTIYLVSILLGTAEVSLSKLFSVTLILVGVIYVSVYNREKSTSSSS